MSYSLTSIKMEDAIHAKLVDIHLRFQIQEEAYKKHLQETQALLEENSIELFRIEQMIENREIEPLSKTQLKSLIDMKVILKIRIRSYKRLIDSTKARKQKLAEDKEELLNVFFEKHRRTFVRESSFQRMASFVRAAF